MENDYGVRALGELVEDQLAQALASLERRDLHLADATVRRDSEVNAARYAIEERVTNALQAATERDQLRELIAILNVISDLERIGDHAEGIAKVTLMLGDQHGPSMGLIRELGALVSDMLHRGIDAFHRHDTDLARQICADDDHVDARYDDAYSEVIAAMTSGGGEVVPHTYVLWIAHNLERIADRVTNICERTVYLVTGDLTELNVSNY